MSIESRAARQVAEGALLFDRRAHEGWFWDIDLDNLSVADPTRCPAAQVFGTFTRGLDDLLHGLDWQTNISEHGLACFPEQDPIYVREWRHQVQNRRDAALMLLTPRSTQGTYTTV